MQTLEDLIRDSMQVHEAHAPDSSGLLAGVAERERARRRRLRGVAAGSTVTVVLGVAGGLIAANMTARGEQRPVDASATSAAAQALPGGEVVTLLASPVVVDRTGSAVVEIGLAPEGADHIQIKFTCLSAGTFTFADGASATCSAADVSSVTAVTTYELRLATGQHRTTITTEAESRWRLSVSYARVSTSAWGINASGQTFGVANAKGTPTLVAVIATNGKAGYCYAQELSRPQPANPSEALAWQNASHPEVQVPVYTSDGKTVIGTFVAQQASDGN